MMRRRRNRRRMHPYGMVGLRKGPGCQCAVCRDDIPQARARFKADTTRILDEWQESVNPDPWDDDLEFCGPWTRWLVDTDNCIDRNWEEWEARLVAELFIVPVPLIGGSR